MANYKKDYIRIENRSQYLLDKVTAYHPDDPRYIDYWKGLKKQCIEGLWGYETGVHNDGVPGYRYMPGRLFFYGNFCTILDFDEAENNRVKIRPEIRDIEWERAYMILEAEGFSGWSEDDRYTSDSMWYDYKENGIPDLKDVSQRRMRRHLTLLRKDGTLKEYKDPRKNIRELHSDKLGVPLYWNSSKNILELGSRGGGRS